MIIRGTRSNCVPLLVLLVLILATIFISYIWKLLPIFWIIRFLKCVRQVFQKKSKVHTYAEEADILASRKAAKKAKKPGSGDNEDNKEEDEEAGGTSEPPSDVLQMDKGAYLTEFEIAALNHPLRQEAAPFTDDYYHYALDLHEDNYRREGMCGKRDPDDSDFLSEQQVIDNWVMKNIRNDRYRVRQKLWDRTGVHNGLIRRKGNPKRTYEIMDDEGQSSYEIDRVPAYKMAMRAFEEALTLHADNADLEGFKMADGGTVKKKGQGEIKPVKAPSVVEKYKSLKVHHNIQAKKKEDWEIGTEDMNEDYKKVANKKKLKKEQDLENAMNDAYGTHEFSESDDDDDIIIDESMFD